MMKNMTAIILSLALLVGVNCPVCFAGDTEEARLAAEGELYVYVMGFLEPIKKTRAYGQRIKTAVKLIPHIVYLSSQAGIDPLLVAVMVSYESSWNFAAVGKLGERGPLQVHGQAAKGYNPSDPIEGLQAGIEHLSRALGICGDIPGALTRYGTGNRCKPEAKFVTFRMKAYEKAKSKYRTN